MLIECWMERILRGSVKERQKQVSMQCYIMRSSPHFLINKAFWQFTGLALWITICFLRWEGGVKVIPTEFPFWAIHGPNASQSFWEPWRRPLQWKSCKAVLFWLYTAARLRREVGIRGRSRKLRLEYGSLGILSVHRLPSKAWVRMHTCTHNAHKQAPEKLPWPSFSRYLFELSALPKGKITYQKLC